MFTTYPGEELQWLHLCFLANPDLVLGPPAELRQEPAITTMAWVSLLDSGRPAFIYGVTKGCTECRMMEFQLVTSCVGLGMCLHHLGT